jgi:Strabismus protein
MLWSEEDQFPPQTWTILCDHIVSRSAEHNTSFQLCKGDTILHITVRQLPNLRFNRVPSRTGEAFVLRLDNEASV